MVSPTLIVLGLIDRLDHQLIRKNSSTKWESSSSSTKGEDSPSSIEINSELYVDNLLSATKLLKAANFSEEEKRALIKFKNLHNISPYKKNKNPLLRYGIPFYLYHCLVEYGITYDQWDTKDKFLPVLEGSTTYSIIRDNRDFLYKLLDTKLNILEQPKTLTELVNLLLEIYDFDSRKVPEEFLTKTVEDCAAFMGDAILAMGVTPYENLTEEQQLRRDEVDDFDESNQLDGRQQGLVYSLITKEFRYLLVYISETRRADTYIEFIPGQLLYRVVAD